MCSLSSSWPGGSVAIWGIGIMGLGRAKLLRVVFEGRDGVVVRGDWMGSQRDYSPL